MLFDNEDEDDGEVGATSPSSFLILSNIYIRVCVCVYILFKFINLREECLKLFDFPCRQAVGISIYSCWTVYVNLPLR